MPAFIKGLQLSELFFHEAVQPILSKHFPQIPYAAARLDFGSDVLGFDTPRSRDHDWGPRLMLFLREADLTEMEPRIMQILAHELPLEVHGYPTNFGQHEDGSGVMQPVAAGPVNPYIPITSVERFFRDYTGIEVAREMSAVDWLVVPWQRLATISAGKVFYDGLEELKSIQESLRWYSHDLWLYILAAQWQHIDQEEPFMARCGDCGDELGSRDVAARMVHRLMQLCFLMEKRYPPYAKWFGTAFAQQNCAVELAPNLQRVHDSRDWKERERCLSEAYLVAGRMHSRLNLTPAIQPQITNFHNRPYLVPHAGRYVEALREKIESPEVLALPAYVGSIDQFVYSTDFLESIPLCQCLRSVYKPGKGT